MRHMPTTRAQSGMTIVELMISIVIISIILTAFVTSLISAYHTSFERKTRLELDSIGQNATEMLERDVRFSKRFNTKVTPPFNDEFGMGTDGTWTASDWSYAGVPASPTSRVLILTQNATSQNALSRLRTTILKRTADPCSYLNDPLEYRIMYFVRNKNLYRRILADTTTPTCGVQVAVQKQSCPPDAPSGAWDPTVCKARDELLAKEVSEFRVNYYTDAIGSSPISAQYSSDSQSILDGAEVIEVTLQLSRQFSGSAVSSTQTFKVAKVNR